MTQAEKAMAYDEALGKAEEFYNDKNNIQCVNVEGMLEEIFPELKESEDEEIRKGLIKAFGSIGKKEWGGVNVKNAIAWLEKQGEQKPTDEEMKELLRTEYEKGRADALAECRFDYSNANIQQKDYAEQKLIEPALWHDVNEEPEEMREILCEWESDDATWHDVCFYDSKTNKFRKDKMPIDNVTKWVYVDELLEKQGEQKVSYTTIVETGNGGINALVTKELYVDKTEQKPTWSEEDDAYKLFAISAVEDYYDEKNPLQKELVDWLKSLKEKIQPKQEWSKEDEKIRKKILDLVSISGNGNDWEEINNWLEKQSDETKIEALRTEYEKGRADAFAWFERQGSITKSSEEEQNRFAKGVLSRCALSFINYLDANSYEGKKCVSNGECEDIVYAFINEDWDKIGRYYNKFTQKPIEWSEKDEKCLFRALLAIQKEMVSYKGSGVNIAALQDCEDWLKSLKERSI